MLAVIPYAMPRSMVRRERRVAIVCLLFDLRKSARTRARRTRALVRQRALRTRSAGVRDVAECAARHRRPSERSQLEALASELAGRPVDDGHLRRRLVMPRRPAEEALHEAVGHLFA